MTWLDVEEREGVATYLLGRAGIDGPPDPWELTQRLGVMLKPIWLPGMEGMCLTEPPAIWIRPSTKRYRGAGRLAHELAHLASHWCGAPDPHDEPGIDDIAARILVPSRWIRSAINRGMSRISISNECIFARRIDVMRRIAEVMDSREFQRAAE